MSWSDLKPCPFCGSMPEPRYECAGPLWACTIACTKDGCGATVRSKICASRTEARAGAMQMWNRRAERTCRDVSERPWQLWCSECGARLDLEDNDGEPTLWNPDGSPLPVNFCPRCGAKVVAK